MSVNARAPRLQDYRYAPVSEEAHDTLLYNSDAEHTEGEYSSDDDAATSVRLLSGEQTHEPHDRFRRRAGYSCIEVVVLTSAVLAMTIVAGIAVGQRQARLRPTQAMEAHNALVGLMEDARGLAKSSGSDGKARLAVSPSAKPPRATAKPALGSKVGSGRGSKPSALTVGPLASPCGTVGPRQLPRWKWPPPFVRRRPVTTVTTTPSTRAKPLVATTVPMQTKPPWTWPWAKSQATTGSPCATLAPIKTTAAIVKGSSQQRRRGRRRKASSLRGNARNNLPVTTVTTTPAPALPPNPCGVIPHVGVVMRIGNLSFSKLAGRLPVMTALSMKAKQAIAGSSRVSPDNVHVGLKPGSGAPTSQSGSLIVAVDIAPSIGVRATDILTSIQPKVCGNLASALNSMPDLVNLASGSMGCSLQSIFITGLPPPSTKPQTTTPMASGSSRTTTTKSTTTQPLQTTVVSTGSTKAESSGYKATSKPAGVSPRMKRETDDIRKVVDFIFAH